MIRTYQECVDEFGSKRAFDAQIAQGRLHKVDRGLYSELPYENLLAILAKRYPTAIVNLESAFFYWNLTDVIPERLHVASLRNSTKISDERFSRQFVPHKSFAVGLTVIERCGVKIRTYDLERLCIDVMRSRNKLPYDLYKEVVLSLRSRVHEMYPARIDDYLEFIPYRNKIMNLIEKEIF